MIRSILLASASALAFSTATADAATFMFKSNYVIFTAPASGDDPSDGSGGQGDPGEYAYTPPTGGYAPSGGPYSGSVYGSGGSGSGYYSGANPVYGGSGYYAPGDGSGYLGASSGYYSAGGVYAGAYSSLPPGVTFTAVPLVSRTGDGRVAIDAASVPEPAAWNLMLSGFGFLGYVLRRRREWRTSRV